MTPDIFERTVARTQRTMAFVAIVGAMGALAWRGWVDSASFLAGALASWFNFRWLKGFVAGLGPDGKPSASAVLFVFRYLILAAGAYVILKYSKLSLPAALTGLFVPLVAVIIEALILLRYARRNLDH